MNEWPPMAFGLHFPPPPDWKWTAPGEGFTIPKGYGPIWEQQLCDNLTNAQRRVGLPTGGSQQPEDQAPSGSQPRWSSRQCMPAATHPDDVYGSMDPTSRQQVDLRRGVRNINRAEDPAQPLQDALVALADLLRQGDNKVNDNLMKYMSHLIATLVKSLHWLARKGEHRSLKFCLHKCCHRQMSVMHF